MSGEITLVTRDIFLRAFRIYFRILEKTFPLTSSLLFGNGVISKPIKDLLLNLDTPLDERIAKIDAARSNLLEGISAIDQLRAEAEDSKKALQDAAQRIEALKQERQSAEKQLAEIKKLADVDAEALKQLIGAPSPNDVLRERIYGFFGGILASLIASLLIYAGHTVWDRIQAPQIPHQERLNSNTSIAPNAQNGRNPDK